MQSSVPSKFYNIFWNNTHCQNIFLKHKEQLLEKEEIDIGASKKNYYLQRFVISNSLKRNDSFHKIEQRITNRNIQTNHNLEVLTNKNIDEQKINEYFKDKLGKPIEKITKCLTGSNISQIKFISELTTSLISEKRMLKFLQKYEFIGKDVSSFELLTKKVEKFFDTEFSRLINSDHFIDLVTSLDEISTYYNNYNFNDLIDANKFYTDILYDKENYNSRINLFDLLFESGSLIGGVYKSYYECTHCGIDIFSGSVTLNVNPSKVKLKCPNCNKEVFYLVPYKINDAIFNDIISKDGLLHSAVINLLISNNIPYKSNVTVGNDVEIDLQIINKHTSFITDIIEMKMFKNNRPYDTQLANLRGGLKKLLQARDKLIEIDINYTNVKFHYLTNIVNDDLFTELKKSFHNELKISKVTILNIEKFKNYVEELVQNRS